MVLMFSTQTFGCRRALAAFAVAIRKLFLKEITWKTRGIKPRGSQPVKGSPSAAGPKFFAGTGPAPQPERRDRPDPDTRPVRLDPGARPVRRRGLRRSCPLTIWAAS